MRIALLYPPPWKVPSPGEKPDPHGDGPPRDAQGIDLEGDFRTIPYGLLSLAAEAEAAGHQVKVLNLSSFPWAEVEPLLRRLQADVCGLTCFTSNRRGVALAAEAIRTHHPAAHIVVGGPHVTALPAETLAHWPAVDTLVIGEGEVTFLELLGRLQAGAGVEPLAGAAWRSEGGEVRLGPPRERIGDLDSLAPLHERFAHYVLLTSRGCPGECSFCASNTIWGRKVRFHSVEYVLDAMESMLRRLPMPMIAVKDDTFTANRRRAMRICEGIRDRGLNFLWSCDTRADVLDEELLRALRLAGCQRISLGVESASEKVLRNIRKRITPAQVRQATALARKVGLHVRWYMMAGNRGETVRTFQQGLDLIGEARPNDFIYSILSVYPGTTEFEVLRRAKDYVGARPGPHGPELLRRSGGVTAETFFDEDFMQLWALPDMAARNATEMVQWLRANSGLRHFWRPDVEHCRAVLRRLGDCHAAHLDLGAAHAFANQPDDAERHVRRALELGYPVPALARNYLACIAGQRGDVNGMKAHLQAALEQDPPHPLLAANLQTLTDWLADGGPKSRRPLNLTMRHDFEIVPADCQPVRPGPLPADICDWPATPRLAPPHAALAV